MPGSIDPVAFATELIACPSVTPASGEVFDVLECALTALGFNVHRWVMGEAPDGPTENMVPVRGRGGRRSADWPRRQRHEERHRGLCRRDLADRAGQRHIVLAHHRR